MLKELNQKKIVNNSVDVSPQFPLYNQILRKTFSPIVMI